MTLGDPQALPLTDSLTPAQRAAVDTNEKRVVLYAGAGAGKTRVLTLRVARMVDEGVDPQHILVVTFSRKAAQELRTRLWRLDIEGVRAGTFHRTALELLEVHRAEQGLGPPILVTDRRGVIAKLIARDTTSSPANAATAIDGEISWAKAQGLKPSEYEEAAERSRRRCSQLPRTVAQTWSTYEDAKRAQGRLDFDDVLVDAAKALSDPRFAAAIHWRSRHVLIDEFQDITPTQFELVEGLLSPEATLFCVGDPNQSIYGFTGADPTLLGSLERRFPGTQILALDANHRSTPEIVLAATSVLRDQDRRTTRSVQSPGRLPEIVACEDDGAEASYVARRAADLKSPGSRWRSVAVLARTNAQLEAISRACLQAGIPTRRLGDDARPASDIRRPASNPRHHTDAPHEDAIALCTFHRAKGLEWPYVFVIGASEGFIPHGAADTGFALEEERRLLYVALTRAELGLVVTWAKRREAGESSRIPPRQRSRFLDPLSRELERLSAAARPAPSATGAARVAMIRRELEARRTPADEASHGRARS